MYATRGAWVQVACRVQADAGQLARAVFRAPLCFYEDQDPHPIYTRITEFQWGGCPDVMINGRGMRTVDVISALFGEMLVQEDERNFRARHAIVLEGVSQAGKTVFLALLQATLPPGKVGKWAQGQDTWGPEGLRDTWMLVVEEAQAPPMSRVDAIKVIDGTAMECRLHGAATTALTFRFVRLPPSPSNHEYA